MTYSIVARNETTGELGVAVASHAFAIGRDVVFARPGVGAVATQGVPDPGHGERLLDLLAAGASADEALAAVTAADGAQQLRQTAVVGVRASPAVHRGALCIPHAGHTVGGGFVCQGNLLAVDRTWEKMAAAYRNTSGEWEDRLLAALEAGLSAGGDLRGQQAAAILVVGPEPGSRPRTSLRIDDHAQPLAQLRRLLDLDRADRRLRAAISVVTGGPGDRRRAIQSLREVQRVFGPANREPDFWAAMIAEIAGGADTCPDDDRWQELRRRLHKLMSPSTSELSEEEKP
ncbi:DUF1028 domain-containing protein [Phytoactinopolyspora limicola]|uniref:DUF1028 domain-containing protein n=1 Tax=Phytoactinopolyspora limicola TaxID=2715536 RepID=UPI00140A1D47|nr:DUF1028 domain-containing protein [Phytoactinopolyspora limicola]